MYQYFLAPIIGYLLGSIPFAWIIVKIAAGKDVREEGAGSVSTRNTIRTAGYSWAILTGILDIGKGFLAVFITRFYLAPSVAMGSDDLSILCAAFAGIGAFVGHLWMIWMKFKGGKAFSVLLGSLFVLNPWGILVWVIAILLFLVIIRYSYLAGLSATICNALLCTFFYIFTVPNPYWSSWAVMVHGWGCVIILVLRLIPEFKAMRRGEIKRWSGVKASQWTK
ncbi:MAG TPA: glycerol-3-phosphate acyltransferase [candidate division Zixibacteria bacterium]|nr:glycerol-3-phosphate acyltransferase [candidate division Zixibacteria bacterium]